MTLCLLSLCACVEGRGAGDEGGETWLEIIVSIRVR